jgi:hypothetical protein
MEMEAPEEPEDEISIFEVIAIGILSGLVGWILGSSLD